MALRTALLVIRNHAEGLVGVDALRWVRSRVRPLGLGDEAGDGLVEVRAEMAATRAAVS
jgi:hypothetical protein